MLHRFQVTVTSSHQLFRGDCVNQAFVVELLQRNHYWRTPIIRRDLLRPRNYEQWTLDRWKSVLWSDVSKLSFWFQPCVFVRCRVGKRMISMKHGGVGVMLWECFAGDTVIYLEFKAHLTSMATTAFCSDTVQPSGLRLVGLSFNFQQDNAPTHLQAL